MIEEQCGVVLLRRSEIGQRMLDVVTHDLLGATEPAKRDHAELPCCRRPAPRPRAAASRAGGTASDPHLTALRFDGAAARRPDLDLAATTCSSTASTSAG